MEFRLLLLLLIISNVKSKCPEQDLVLILMPLLVWYGIVKEGGRGRTGMAKI